MERMTIMMYDIPMMEIELDGINIKSKIINSNGSSKIRLRSLYPDIININSFNNWLMTRLPDPTRADIDDILKKYDVPDFMPYHMCKKSHGVRVQDQYWIKWDGEGLSYEDIRIG